jgi:Tfp pilus assembly protein PilV
MNNARGQMLVEVLIACGALVIGSLMLASFATSIRPLAKHGNNELQALFLAKEGIEAARAIRDNDFNFLTDGAHGITFGTSTWAFTEASDTVNGFTRTVTISPFDLRTKKITSTVTGTYSSSTLTTLLLDTDQDLGMAHFIAFDLDSANSDLDNGNKQLNGMILKNIGPFPITIKEMTAWWDDDSKIQSAQPFGAITAQGHQTANSPLAHFWISRTRRLT